MAIRDNRYKDGNPWKRKENIEWEMAGLARQDGDKQDEERHTAKAREFAQKAVEWDAVQ